MYENDHFNQTQAEFKKVLNGQSKQAQAEFKKEVNGKSKHAAQKRRGKKEEEKGSGTGSCVGEIALLILDSSFFYNWLYHLV